MSIINNTYLLEGYISVKAALNSNNREIHCIYLIKSNLDRVVLHLENKAKNRGIKVIRTDVEEINTLTSGSTHGGIVAVVGERKYQEINQMAKPTRNSFLVMLTGVEDPYNFGYSVRSLFAAGAHGLIIPSRNWFTASGIVARASAGASELIDICTYENAEVMLDILKQSGYRLIATSDRDTVSLYEVDFDTPFVLIVGGEKRGIPKSILNMTDVTITIPYGRSFHHSLSTTAATAILSFEIMRQRKKPHYGRIIEYDSSS